MSRIVRGYWKCDFCNTKDIDGLKDNCPNCGKQKSADVKYYILNTKDYVSDKELESANMKRENCDGKHPDWICPYCNQLNNYLDNKCVACGSSKTESTKNYFTINIEDNIDRNKEIKNSSNKNIKINKNINFLYIFIALIMLLLTTILFWPHKEEFNVIKLSWQRTIDIEELKTFDEDGWSLPTDARLHYTKQEIHHYDKVIDHYKTETVQKSRQVQDGYTTSYSYSDNGDGTFTEHKINTPNYRTEYYTENEQVPVYKDVPRYQTKYYYEIDRWTKISDSKSSGESHDTYWNEDYELKDNQRDTTRYETYYVLLDNKKNVKDETKDDIEKTYNYNDWININIGDSYYVKKSILGIVYEVNELQ